MKFPHKLPKWTTWELYHDWYKECTVVLCRNYYTGEYLVAPKIYIVIKPLFIARDRVTQSYWRVARKIIRYAARKGWLQPEDGDKICWHNIKKWRKYAKL